MATVVRLDFMVNWHDSIQISHEVSLSWKPLVYLRGFYNKYLFENKRRKRKLSSVDRLGR